jgi:hypothetical protein
MIASGPYAYSNALCDICKVKINCNNGRWHCYPCKFDLCINCASNSVFNYYNAKMKDIKAEEQVIEASSKPVAAPDEKFQCKICIDKIVEFMLMPCGHMLCRNCSEITNKCPFDRQNVTQRVRMFFT